MNRSILIIASVFALAIAPAFGLSIVQTKTFSGNIGTVDETYTFNQFDDAGGTLVLDSILVEVGLESIGGQRGIDNDDDASSTGSVEIGLAGAISSLDVSLIDIALQPIGAGINASTTGSVTVQGDDGDSEVGGTANFSQQGTDYALYTAGIAVDGDTGFVDPLAWAGYLGTGTYDIDVDYLAFTSFQGFGGIQDAGEPPVSSGVLQITYNYHEQETFIPEPMSLAAVSTGLAGLLGYLRRRK